MKKKALSLLLALAFYLALPIPASANSAEPPYLTILVEHPPADLKLTLTLGEGSLQESYTLQQDSLLWEGYYRFYIHIWSPWAPAGTEPQTASLLVENGGTHFSLSVEPKGFSYSHNLVTLDLANQRLLYGQPWWRQPLLVVLRVALTLALEGLIFYLWGYQEKRSWIIFLVVNLVTQFGVNIAILCFLPAASRTYDAMWAKVLLYGPMEVLVILLEAIALPLLLKEQRKGTAVGCSVMANILSWFLGAVLLSLLPV